MTRPRHVRARQPTAIDQALERAGLALNGSQFVEAEQLALRVPKSNWGNVPAAQILGQSLLLQDRPQDAIRLLARAARLSEDPAAETLLARALAAVDRLDESLNHLRLACSRRPAFAAAFLELGERLGDAGELDEGIAVLEAGSAECPDAVGLRVGLGFLYLKAREFDRARAAFQTAHAEAPGRRDALAGLAKVAAVGGDYSTAAGFYRQALEKRPSDALTRIGLGQCQLELGDRRAGEESLRAAVGQDWRLAGLALATLAATSHGRLFLRPSAATKFLRGDAR